MLVASKNHTTKHNTGIYGDIKMMKKYKIRVYNPIMGVPITFLDKYSPDQFEIVGLGIVGSCEFTNERRMEILDKNGVPTGKYTVNAKGTLYRKHLESDKKPAVFKDYETGELYQSIYARILIKRKQ